MPTGLYDAARQAFLDGEISWTRDPVRAVLIDESLYRPDLAAHKTLAEIPQAARVATSMPLMRKESARGVASAASVTFSAVPDAAVGALALYHDSGDEAGSRLIAYIGDGLGLPLRTMGGAVTITWDANPDARIFKL